MAPPLPSKQMGLFKRVLKCYDYKQYRMGLKLVQQILSYPETSEHGETLAMKGLLLNCLGRKEEAFELVRRGLRNDIMSHICWHVYGLLQKSELKYDEAIKCYRNALKQDKNNLTILRDLSNLQIHMRDLEGFLYTRYQLFQLRPSQRASWLGYAIAYHLLKDHELAFKILDTQAQTEITNKNAEDDGNEKKKKFQPIDYEHSELLLYQISVILESGNYQKALDYLNKYEKSNLICDRLALLEYRVRIYLELERFGNACEVLREKLIPRNSENSQYYQQLELAICREKDPKNVLNDCEKRFEFYSEMQKKYPSSQVPFKLPLQIIDLKSNNGKIEMKNLKKFVNMCEIYVRRSIRKGLPALFRSLKTVYDEQFASCGLDVKLLISLDCVDDNFGAKNLNGPKTNNNITNDKNSETTEKSSEKNDEKENEKDNKLDKSSFDLVRQQRALVYAKYCQNYDENLCKDIINSEDDYLGDEKSPLIKMKILENLILKYEKNLDELDSFESNPMNIDGNGKNPSKHKEGPACLLWTYYYLAQHYDYLGQYDRSLQYVQKGLNHTPTLIELLVMRAKIHKHRGEFEKGAEFMNEAQRLDTADRYLNSKCAKYLIRAHKIQEAEDLCSKFTRTGVAVTETLLDMQCMWFTLECARAYSEMSQFGKSLKKCYEINAYFQQVNEDQFDFHSYCMRKMTLRSYIALLRLEDVLKSHKFYFQCAKIAIKIYLHLYDHPLDASIDSSKMDKKALEISNKDGTKLSESELKKLKNKQRKAAAKAADSASAPHNNKQKGGGGSSNQSSDHQKSSSAGKSSSSATSGSGTAGTGNSSDKYDNLHLEKCDPQTLEHPQDALERALEFLRPLKMLCQDRIETHLLAFEIYRRQNKFMLMLQSIKRACKVNAKHVKLQQQLSLFLQLCDQKLSLPPNPIDGVTVNANSAIVTNDVKKTNSVINTSEKVDSGGGKGKGKNKSTDQQKQKQQQKEKEKAAEEEKKKQDGPLSGPVRQVLELELSTLRSHLIIAQA